MDLLPGDYKAQVNEKYKAHIQWLKKQDHLTRASKGFESALDWMNKKDMSHHMPMFVRETRKYDKIRDENFDFDFYVFGLYLQHLGFSFR